MKIIVHGGKAHSDEFIAAGLVSATVSPTGAPMVLRRDPTEEELLDPEVWVIDVGGRLEPELHNFDHHQDRDLPAAFVLVARELGVEELAQRLFPWWDHLSILDTRGPVQAAKWLGIPLDMYLATLHPLQGMVLGEFENPGLPADLLVRQFGAYLMNTLREVQDRLSLLASSAELTKVGDLAVVRHEIREKPDLALSLFREQLGGDLAVSVCPHPRGGWALYRFNDHPRVVDFTRVGGDPRVSFVHTGGFLAILRDAHKDDWRELVALATATA